MSIYQEQGFKDRNEYLKSLADENDVSLETVLALVELLGETEDFDGLVTAVQEAKEHETTYRHEL